MAHTTQKVNLGNVALALVTFTSYTQGGEQFTLTEFGLTGSLVGVYNIALQTLQSMVVDQELDLVPQSTPGLYKLMTKISGDTEELPTTGSMSYVVLVLVVGTI